MMLPATVTQQRGVPGSIYCHGHPERPRYRARTSMSNRSKKRPKPARFGKCLGLSLTKKWHVPVLFGIGLFEGLHATTYRSHCPSGLAAIQTFRLGRDGSVACSPSEVSIASSDQQYERAQNYRWFINAVLKEGGYPSTEYTSRPRCRTASAAAQLSHLQAARVVPPGRPQPVPRHDICCVPRLRRRVWSARAPRCTRCDRRVRPPQGRRPRFGLCGLLDLLPVLLGGTLAADRQQHFLLTRGDLPDTASGGGDPSSPAKLIDTVSVHGSTRLRLSFRSRQRVRPVALPGINTSVSNNPQSCRRPPHRLAHRKP